MVSIDIYKVSGRHKLWFAEDGIKLRDKIIRRISKNRESRLIKLDFGNIDVTDASFAREGFVHLVNWIALHSPRPQVLFVNINEYVKQNLDLSFKAHKKMALIVDKKSSWELIGKHTQQARDTIDALTTLQEATAKEVAEKLKIGLTTCNNRLNGLYEMCIITRKEIGQKSGGVEYLYCMSI